MMKLLVLTIATALPLMAFGQTADTQQTQAQTSDTQTETTAPAKGKVHASAQEQTDVRAKAKTEKMGTDVREHTNVKGRTDANARTNTTTKTKVNVQEFKSRHSEVFSLGRHPKEFFVEKFGANHFRMFGNTYFVFVDSCWVAVDVDGFAYTERVICPGDPEFVAVY